MVSVSVVSVPPSLVTINLVSFFLVFLECIGFFDIADVIVPYGSLLAIYLFSLYCYPLLLFQPANLGNY